MKVNKQTHLLEDVRFVCSPNFDERPLGVNVSLLVIHAISLPPNEFGNGFVEDFFMNRLDPTKHPYFKTIEALKVSSHIFIDRQGSVTQFVPFDKRAWHAGVSEFKGVNCCNDFSIGIELEGGLELCYTNEQYEALSLITKSIVSEYKIPICHVVGHSDIAPTRKLDPGPHFEWERYRSMAGLE